MEVLHYFLKAFIKAETNKRRAEAKKLAAVNDAKQKLQSAVEAGDDRTEALCLIELGNVYAFYSEYELSDTMYRQGLALARAIPDQHLEIVALANLGLSYKTRSEYSQAFTYYQKALTLARKTGDRNIEKEIIQLMDELGRMIDLDTSAKIGG
jgi:tetratricopeptide (TPR) repeat protein